MTCTAMRKRGWLIQPKEPLKSSCPGKAGKGTPLSELLCAQKSHASRTVQGLYQRPYALTCHPERSEGSPRNGWGFFASLRMTQRVCSSGRWYYSSLTWLGQHNRAICLTTNIN